MIGGNLTEMDQWTTSLLTNREILAVDQHATDSRQVLDDGRTVIWLAQTSDGDGEYVAVFNRDENIQVIEHNWKDLGLEGNSYRLRDVWEHKNLGRARSLKIQLPGHGCVLYRASSK
jgi:hypothetical protein